MSLRGLLLRRLLLFRLVSPSSKVKVTEFGDIASNVALVPTALLRREEMYSFVNWENPSLTSCLRKDRPRVYVLKEEQHLFGPCGLSQRLCNFLDLFLAQRLKD